MKINTKKIIHFFITINTILYALAAAIYAKGGIVYAETQFIDGIPKVVNLAVSKKIEKAVSNIIDAPTENHFPYGQCTWYLATRRNVPWNGNARDWYANAQAFGRKVGKVPIVGSILVTNESIYGHVAYVEKISGDVITISEMNNPIWGKVTQRKFDYHNSLVIGFIY